MTTPVNGPGDVKVGDLVEVRPYHTSNSRHCVGVVTKVGADKLTVKREDGKTSAMAYVITYTSQSYLNRRQLKHRNFHRMSAWERWVHVAPKDGASATFGGERVCSAVITDMDAIRDRPDDVCAQIHALSAWLKAEPPKDAP